MRRWSRRISLTAAVAVAGVLAYAAPAHADVFPVTKTTDDVGPCLIADCSLRAAVLEANGDSGADTITLPAGTYALTLPDGPGPDPESGDLDIVFDVTIRKQHGDVGAVVLDGLGATRLIEVPFTGFPVIVTLERLRLDRGIADAFSGGGLRIGAPGLFNLDRVAVTNSAGGGGIVVTDPFATVRLAGGNVSDNVGGGISFAGTLRVLDSQISGNGRDWGGITGSGNLEVYRSDLERNISSLGGGGIHLLDGTLLVEDSTLRENRAEEGSGGGIRVSDGAEKLVVGSTIEDNDALVAGGGVYVADGTDLLVQDSTVWGNSAPSGGGIAADGSLNLSHSTVSGNTAASSGGGLFIGSDGQAFLSHVTISANLSEFGSGIHNLGEQQWGLVVAAANPGGDCAGAAPTVEFASFVGTAGCDRASGDGDAMLGDLEANGGPTLTHLPRDGSPLIDGGEGFSCGAYDQRGYLPPDGRPCDIGAVEVEGEGNADLRVQKVDNVDPAELNGDLVYEIQLANDGPGRAWGAQLVDEIPLSEDVVAVTSEANVHCEVTPRGEEGENGVRCKLGSIGAGQTEVVYIHVRPTTGGDILNEATGSAGSSDPDPNNNTSDETTTVGFLVTNTEDSGPGSLRQAILDANANPGEDVIAFFIPGGGVHTIVPATALPAITDQVRIDGYTQPGSNPNTLDVGNNAVLLVEIDGNGGFFDGLRVIAGGAGSRIRGLVVNDFNGDAIQLSGAGGIIVEGNYVGTNAAGDVAVPSRSGVYMVSSPNNRIGGMSPAERNVLVAGQNYPIWTQTPDAAGGGVVIQGNYIGSNAQGTAVLGVSGIALSNADNVIGGVLHGAGNVIANQGRPGIHLDESEANDNTIQGNYIGVTADGTAVLGNATGIEIQRASGNLIGGSDPAARNVIVGASGPVTIFGVSGIASGNTIEGNYIGTNAAGTAALPIGGGAGSGVLIDSSADNVVAGNLISGQNTGVRILSQAPASTGNRVEGNRIGTNAAGTSALPNGTGIAVGATGGAPSPSADNVIGGTTAAKRNVVSGNTTDGIRLFGALRTTIQGNYVGVAADGVTALANQETGIEISTGSDNVIGGTAPGAGNVIAYNGTFFTVDGIAVLDGTGNAIRGNSIHSNQQLGIDLGNDGVTLNDAGDADVGPNNRQNFPVTTSAAVTGDATNVAGTLNSAPSSSYALDFYAGPDCGETGTQGKTYLGSAGVLTDGDGSVVFEDSLPVAAVAGDFVTATATDAQGNTSEFSGCLMVVGGDFVVTSTNDSGAGSLRQAILDANARPGEDTIAFTISGSEPHTISLASPLPPVSDTTVIDATTQPGYVDAPVVEISGVALPAGSKGLDLAANGSTVRGLSITGFTGPPDMWTGVGIRVRSSASSSVIEANYLGVDPDGLTAQGNQVGVSIESSDANIVGGATPAARNVISGNTKEGVLITGAGIGNIVKGNTIGLNRLGSRTIPNGGNGVMIDGGTSAAIGGPDPGDGNVIAANEGYGISVASTAATIQGNQVGAAAEDPNCVITQPASIAGDTPTEITFVNNSGTTVQIFWLDYEGNRVLYTSLGAGTGYTQPTWLTHPWVAVDPDGTCIGYTISDTLSKTYVIEPPPDLANGSGGILVDGDSNTIGGTSAGARNVISGNAGDGVVINGGTDNTVLGNYIGLDGAGSAEVPNSGSGVSLTGGGANTIGGLAAGAANTISGNGGHGILVGGGVADVTTVQGNLIGLDAAGEEARPNGAGGLHIGSPTLVGGTAAGARNVVSGNDGHGIEIVNTAPSGTDVLGNYIGTDFTGTADVGNTREGIRVENGANRIGGADNPAARNVVSGNDGFGILIHGASGNLVRGNYVGTNHNGSAPLGNGWDGIGVDGGSNNVIGGAGFEAGNLVSANAGQGIAIFGVDFPSTTGNVVKGNRVGTSADGDDALANGGDALRLANATDTTVGGTEPGAKNYFMNSDSNGVAIYGAASTGNVVAGNEIAGNVVRGVLIEDAANNTIGPANVITDNGYTATGVAIEGAAIGNRVTQNLIHANEGLGIDLGHDGVTANDPGGDDDGGPNGLQNFPVLDSVLNEPDTVVRGTLASAAQTAYEVEFFANAACDESGHGEGATPLGALSVTTNADGHADIVWPVPTPLEPGAVVTATATDPLGNTSEFSACRALSADFVVNSIADAGGGSLRQAILDANARPGADTIRFAIPGPGVHTIAPLTPLPQATENVTIDGTTEDGFVGPPLIELDGTSTSGSGAGLQLNSAGGTVRGLAIHGFPINVWLVGSNHVVEDSYIGLRADGTPGAGENTGVAVYSSDAMVQRNVVSGNATGVHVTQAFDGTGEGSTIRDNLIGTDPSGTAAIPNVQGVLVQSVRDVEVGGLEAGQGNVIAGNSGDGISLTGAATQGTFIRGNRIGVDADGGALGNGADGILFTTGASSNNVVGRSPVSRNTIAHNAGAGVALIGVQANAPIRNSVTNNSIHSNGGLAIDLGSDGPTTNAPPGIVAEPNEGLDHPVLTSIGAVPGQFFVHGTATEIAPDAPVRFEVYASQGCPASGRGDLETLIGTFEGAFRGDGTFSVNLDRPPADGEVLTATVTDTSGNTSEPSPCFGGTPAVEASVSISAGSANVQAGVSDVAIADVPLEDIVPRATAEARPGSATANTATDPEGAPLGGIPLGGIPLGGIDLARSPLGGIPLGGIGLDDLAYRAVLSRVILSSLPISVPGGWMAVLDGTRFKGVPPQSLTLGQVLADGPSAQAVQALSFGQVDLAASPLGGIPLGGITLGGTPLGGISILGNTGAQNLADWCTLLREEADFACAATNPAAIEHETLLSLGLRGVPLGGIPLGGIPLGGIPLGGIPLGGIPLGGIPLGGIPLGGIPLGGIPLGGIPLGGIPLGGIPFTGPNASPLGGIPLGGIANVEQIVDCTAVDCVNGTLADAAGHFTDAAKLLHLQGVLAGYTLADLKFYGDLTLADIEDLIPANMTLGELLRVLLRRSEFPWEDAKLGALDLQGLSANGSSLPLTASFSVSTGGSSLETTVDVEAELPPGFRYLPGTSLVRNTVDDPPFSPLADPVVSGNTLRWTVSSVPFLTPHELRFQAQPGTTLGLAEATAAATPDGGSRAVAADPASVVVGDTFESNDNLDTAHGVENDHLYFSYVADGDDRDYFEFPSPAAGTRIDVYVSQLSADVDAVLYAPERTVLAPGAGEGIPSGVALGDEGVDLDGSQDRRSPETLRDVPLVAGQAIAGISANRGRETEEIHTVARGTGMYRIQLSGYNGAVTEQPYVLRIVFRQPLIPSCPDRVFPQTGAAASAPAGYDPALNTLFVVNQQRLGATYGAAAAANVTAAAQALAGRADLGVVGGILAVEADAATQQLYGTWDGNPCDPNAANAVMSRIVERVNAVAATHPQLKNIVLVGGDDIVPMARIPDLTRLYNEREHAGSVSNLTNEYFGAFVTEHLLSDDTYGDRDPIRHLDRQLFVPERAVGRLVEQPAAIVEALERFGRPSVQGHVDPQSALVSGYDFLTDGANAIKSELAANGKAPVAANLINDQWTRAQLREALLPPNDAAAPGIASINAHFDQTRALPALGNTQADESDLFTTADLNGAMGRLIGGVVFSMGCHAGLNMSDIAVGTAVTDWAERLGQEGALFAGNTGYGLGDTEVVAYSERLMVLFAERLDGSMTVGEALTFAKQAYYAEHGVFGVYDEKVMAEAVFYGLPMYTLGTPGAPQQPDPPDVGPPSLEPISGLQASPLSFQASLLPGQGLLTFEPVPGGRGTHYNLDGKVQVTHGRPIQPRAEFQVEQPGTLAHGFLVTDLASTDLAGIDPVFARPTGDLEANEPEPTSNDVAFPGKHATVVTYREPLGRKQRLNLVAGQFFDDGVADPLGRGTQRLFTEISGSVLYSDSQDFAQPQIDDVEGAIVGSTASFALDAVDPVRGADGIRRAVVLYLADGESIWRRAELIRTPGTSRWTGGGPAVGAHVEYVVQVVDADGDIGVSSEKARYFDARPQEQPPAGVDFELDGPAGEGGWFRGDVTVELEGARQYRLDGDGFVPYEGAFVVDGDGVHSVEIQDRQGAITTVVVPIDATSPTAVITTPADGGTYPLGENVPADYECLDAASGVAGCTGTAADGAPIDTGSRGAKTFSVTVTDVAGNPAVVVTSHYMVNRRPTAPGAPVAVPSPNPGVFTLSWTPATDADDDPLTYTVEHKDGNDADFTQVATGVTGTSFAFTAVAPESEGTQVYRVRASDGSESGPFSAQSAAVVVDKTPPNVPLLQANRAPDYPGAGGWYKPPVTVTTVAQGDPPLADGSPGSGVALVSPAQSVTTTGTHSITGAAVDAAGNASEGSLALQVDADAPLVAITCPAAQILLGSVATAAWSATDLHSGLATPASGTVALDTSTVGAKTATSPTASDNVGLTKVATCSYSVIFKFAGFFSPIDNLPTQNLVNSGRAIPVKFTLGGYQGLAILALGYPRSQQIPCSMTAPVDGIEETLTAGSSSLQWDGSQYVYVWKTEKSWVSTCRQLIVRFIDGTSHHANFKFTR